MKRWMDIGMALFFSVLICGSAAAGDNLKLKGPYLGQTPPGAETAKLFAPGVVNYGFQTRDMAMTPDGKEIYFMASLAGLDFSAIVITRETEVGWTAPEICAFSGNTGSRDAEPAISPDGTQFFFISNRAEASGATSKRDWDIWVMQREKDGWGEPRSLSSEINTEHGEFFPSVTEDGTLYFARHKNGERAHFIYRSQRVDGVYQPAEKLPEQVNCGRTMFNAFIARDESYIIVPTVGRRDGLGGCDYFIVFRNSDDTWCEPINLGASINTTASQEWSPYVSPDGQYFFFQRCASLTKALIDRQTWGWSALQNASRQPESGQSGIYWIRTDFIDQLKNQAQPQ